MATFGKNFAGQENVRVGVVQRLSGAPALVDFGKS